MCGKLVSMCALKARVISMKPVSLAACDQQVNDSASKCESEQESDLSRYHKHFMKQIQKYVLRGLCVARSKAYATIALRNSRQVIAMMASLPTSNEQHKHSQATRPTHPMMRHSWPKFEKKRKALTCGSRPSPAYAASCGGISGKPYITVQDTPTGY